MGRSAHLLMEKEFVSYSVAGASYALPAQATGRSDRSLPTADSLT